ncbi:MAG: hypothetical protein WC421_01730 [Elusimicrobiales bacterium]
MNDYFEGDGWSMGKFSSPADGLEICYKRRQGGHMGSIPLVCAGGLAVQETAESIFFVETRPERDEYFYWMRGHRPTGWKPALSVGDCDALDLAHMINLAAQTSYAPRVDVLLHSYATVVFQRMIQLHSNGEAAAALQRLRGAKVVLCNGLTGDASRDPELEDFYKSAAQLEQFLSWLNWQDGYAAASPPPPDFDARAWPARRAQALASASKYAVDMTAEHLSAHWPEKIDHIRLRLARRLREDCALPGWQEGIVRRSHAVSKLCFGDADVKRVKDNGVKLTWVASANDQLLKWAFARTVMARFDMTPPPAPQPGAVFRDATGSFEMRIVSGDHYFPLKRPAEALRIIAE